MRPTLHATCRRDRRRRPTIFWPNIAQNTAVTGPNQRHPATQEVPLRCYTAKRGTVNTSGTVCEGGTVQE
eukprot:scaffold39818_cov45-Phaeocystis_antarctica.AAC.1